MIPFDLICNMTMLNFDFNLKSRLICFAGVLGLNPGGPKRFPLWNCLNGVRSNSVRPESASGSGSRLKSVVCL